VDAVGQAGRFDGPQLVGEAAEVGRQDRRRERGSYWRGFFLG
jgi:hypothetical protein